VTVTDCSSSGQQDKGLTNHCQHRALRAGQGRGALEWLEAGGNWLCEWLKVSFLEIADITVVF
jgi:hypothetical protein